VVELSTGVVTGEPFGNPPVHVYVDAPVAVNVAVLPEQTVGEFTPTIGFGLTVTVDVAVFVQLFTSVPVTVYVVVEFKTGVFTLAPLGNPPVHV
jgi:hypothetical protein